METRQKTLAARLLAKSCALPDEDPLRRAAEASTKGRLKTVHDWRQLGREMWEAGEVAPLPIEQILPRRAPPWDECGEVSFCLDVGPLPLGASPRQK